MKCKYSQNSKIKIASLSIKEEIYEYLWGVQIIWQTGS